MYIVYSRNPTFQPKRLLNESQFLPDHVNVSTLAWKRALLRSFLDPAKKDALCLEVKSAFWNSADHPNHSCEQYIGHMTRCINDRK